MEQHAEKHLKNVIAVIPARYASVRLPGKLLREIDGKPLILHTLSQVLRCRSLSRVVVATDDSRIRDVVERAGGEAVMTSEDRESGSDRIAEVAEELTEDSIIVNVQGDEPLISPETIDLAVAAMLADETADIVTTCEAIDSIDDLLSGNVVKVVCNEAGYALYFSRSPVPFPRVASLRHSGNLNLAIAGEPEILSLFRKHTGLYVYRREYLLKFTQLPQSRLEKIEMLEQLRALQNGARIKVVETTTRSIGVDTEADFERVKTLIEAK